MSLFNQYSDYLQNTQGSRSKAPRAKEEWSEEKARFYHNITIEEFLTNKYFFKHWADLYPKHRDDIIELYNRKKAGEDIRYFVYEASYGTGKTWEAGALLLTQVFYNTTIWSYKELYPNISENTSFSFFVRE